MHSSTRNGHLYAVHWTGVKLFISILLNDKKA